VERLVPLRLNEVTIRRTALILACISAPLLAQPAAAGAATAYSHNYFCNSTYSWVRVNWPTILTDSPQREAVYFRAFLHQYRSSGRWPRIGRTRWYVGVSDNRRRYMLDSSFGELPYPFVGDYGHLFAYATNGGSYAGPQLGPHWSNLPSASYRVVEQYQVNGVRWRNRHRGTYCNV
jgi:hypothetical protein